MLLFLPHLKGSIMRLKKTIPLAYILKKARLSLLCILIILSGAGFAVREFGGVLPGLPPGIPLFLCFAVLVMSFVKLNRAYNRWGMLRTTWEMIANDSGSFVLYLQSYLGKEQKAVIRKIAFRHIAWCCSLHQFILGEGMNVHLEGFLSEEDLRLTGTSEHKHRAILRLNTDHIAELTGQHKLSISGQVQLTNKITDFSGLSDTAEAVKSSPVPKFYDDIMYLCACAGILTSFYSFPELGEALKVFLLLIFSSIFMVMEKIAHYLKNPFGSLKTDPVMTNISGVIADDIRKLVDQAEIVAPEPSKLLYIL